MHQRIFIAIIVLSTFAWYINSFSPSENWHFIVFFGLVLLTIFFLFYALLNQFRLSLIISIGSTIYLLLRFWHLTHPFYLIILILFCASLELALTKR